MDGQAIVADVTSDAVKTTVLLTVTAADGVTTKVYTVYLMYKLPTDATLTEIRVKNIPVDNFKPSENIYIFDKLSMEEELPTPQEITVVKSDELATSTVEIACYHYGLCARYLRHQPLLHHLPAYAVQRRYA
jgi:hypothetical protein